MKAMRRTALFAFALLGSLACASVARAGVRAWSELALPVVDLAPGDSEGWLAQRVIDREWGWSDDSTYREVDVPGWKREGVGLALSAALPGTGQVYAGEGRGWFFLLAEAAGWASRALTRRQADDAAGDAQSFLGNPYDSLATFSFDRFARQTGSSTERLEALWANDREAFYQQLTDDPTFVAGWSGTSPEETWSRFREFRGTRDVNLRRAHFAEAVLWVNHVVAAIDAVRAVRSHNLPLQQEYQLRLGQRVRDGQREYRATLVRRF